MFLQATWCKNFDWDDKIDEDSSRQWLTIKPDLQDLSEIHIPRNLKIESTGEIQYSLACFCDASTRLHTLQCCIFVQKDKVDSKSDLIFAKTRLAPIKEISIPRLELMTVLIGVRCIQFVKNQLGFPLTSIGLWSDSQWLCSEKPLPVFVQNIVNEIKEHTGITFAYTPSKENPADIASRGSSVQNLADLWWHGPSWLIKSHYENMPV